MGRRHCRPGPPAQSCASGVVRFRFPGEVDIMIPRYSRPEMARLWSDENRFATWLAVEIAASEVLAERGVVPKEALAAIKAGARFDVARIDAIEQEGQHD